MGKDNSKRMRMIKGQTTRKGERKGSWGAFEKQTNPMTKVALGVFLPLPCHFTYHFTFWHNAKPYDHLCLRLPLRLPLQTKSASTDKMCVKLYE
jgi:hypothetical protein